VDFAQRVGRFRRRVNGRDIVVFPADPDQSMQSERRGGFLFIDTVPLGKMVTPRTAKLRRRYERSGILPNGLNKRLFLIAFIFCWQAFISHMPNCISIGNLKNISL